LKKENEQILLKMPGELWLILSCLRASTDQNKRREIDSLGPKAIDWEVFIKLVNRHRVSSLVYKSLNRFEGDKIPTHVLIRLRERAHRNAQRILSKTTELVHILKGFDQRDIFALSFKGPVLGLLAYGDLCSRHVGDLDIMIPLESIEKADNFLRQEGYQRTHPGFTLTPRQHAVYQRNNYHFRYFCKERAIRVELHYRYGSNPALFPLKFDEAWERRQTVKLGGIDVATLSLEHTIQLICAHGAAHAWFRLFWLNDLAQLLYRHQTIDWTKQMGQANRLGIRRVMAEGVVLATLLLKSRLPQQVKIYGQTDKVVHDLVRMAYYRIRYSVDYPSKPFTLDYFREKLYDIRLRKDLPYKLNFFLYQIGPSYDEFESVILPDLLFFLYFFLRPFTWCFRWYKSSSFAPPMGHGAASGVG